ncbi:amidohydrolase [Sneathiella marina]|uniref:Amidohydrolase n=1 Tax=Sneathiella marina TaxID=2950108 RepID=A0ABY4W6Q3_9PROT|nr:amidohydrolase [Sneathiella marina]USG62504.1 amidohydrolase [Sneathiella marina]
MCKTTDTVRTCELDPSLRDYMVEFRHDVHRLPELGFREKRTSDCVAEALRSFNIEVFQNKGVVGVLKAGNSQRVIALRAELDALPIQETSTHDYASIVPKTMHACGHDGHMAMLLGAAKYLSETRAFDGTVIFIFQPNEENGLGAKAMLEEEVLARFGIEEIYAIHNLPGAPLGEISTRAGLICNSESLFEIEIKGQGGHASMPDVGVDTILVGSEVVQALQTIVARKLPPGSGAVVSVTEFITDGARNILPGLTILKGDVRAQNPEHRTKIERLMRQIATGVAATHDVEVHVKFQTEFIETINHSENAAAVVRVAKRVTNQVIADREPMSFSEDFAYFLAAIPGCLLLLGNGVEDVHGKPLHSSNYDFNDDALMIGARFWASLVAERLPIGDA